MKKQNLILPPPAARKDVRRSSGLGRSDVSLRSSKSRDGESVTSMALPPLDELVVEVLSLKLTDQDTKPCNVKVSFFDQLIISKSIKPSWTRQEETDEENPEGTAKGTIQYDPSDYEKMSLFADNPLVVQVQTMQAIQGKEMVKTKPTKVGLKTPEEAFCCNIDILPVFIERDEICVVRRLQPNILPSLLKRKSFDNLPLLTVQISVIRNEANTMYQKMMRAANYMKITLIGAYNLIIPYDYNYLYTAATKMPVSSAANCTLVTFSQGQPLEEDYSNLKGFYPKWETLRINEGVFSECYDKFKCSLGELSDPELPQHLAAIDVAAVWGSFHRTLVLHHNELWLKKHLRRYKWPLELHLFGDHSCYSFMGFIDLTRLLYPGENRVLVQVPLVWVRSRMQEMMQECGCELLLSPTDKGPSTPTSPGKGSNFCVIVYATYHCARRHFLKLFGGGTDNLHQQESLNDYVKQRFISSLHMSGRSVDSPAASTKTNSPRSVAGQLANRGTGNDGGVAFVILEVMLKKPLVKAAIPPHVSHHQFYEMLMDLEKSPHYRKKRECVGRGQLQRDWEVTMRLAVQALRKVPYYGTTDFTVFYRQLSETRTRAELMTSCQNDAALYVNNNFIVSEYLGDESSYQEMLRVAHLSLMRETVKTLVVPPQVPKAHPLVRAARHSRQMQDPLHAVDLYMQYTTEFKRDGNVWRELGTCLKDVDKEWAIVCFYKSTRIDPMHPLTLVSMGCMVFEDDPEAAEPFFEAILMLFPLWATGWLIVSIYYQLREFYYMADKIYEKLQKTVALELAQTYTPPRVWEEELGDWWDPAPMTSGMSRYFDAADLLLRLRAINWAEFCAARILTLYGESPNYIHLIALCYRLRGDYSEALCLTKSSLGNKAEVRPAYLTSLEAECHHKLGNIEEAMAAFGRITGVTLCPYSTLLGLPRHEQKKARSTLVDLLRRQPTAYGWMALADDWLLRSTEGEHSASTTADEVPAQTCAVACAIQALRIDRRAGRAWALLATYTWPEERRAHCREMANTCGYRDPEDETSETQRSNTPTAYVIGWTLKECDCCMCYHFQIN